MLATQRCRLRPATPADYAGLISAVESAQFPAALPLVKMHQEGRLTAWFDTLLASARDGRAHVYSIEVDGPGGPCVGQVSLVAIGDTKNWNLSFWLHPSHWGKGLVVEAASAVLEHAYGRLGIERVVAGAAVWNTRSTLALAKLGFDPVQNGDPALEGLAAPKTSLIYLLSKVKWEQTLRATAASRSF